MSRLFAKLAAVGNKRPFPTDNLVFYRRLAIITLISHICVFSDNSWTYFDIVHPEYKLRDGIRHLHQLPADCHCVWWVRHLNLHPDSVHCRQERGSSVWERNLRHIRNWGSGMWGTLGRKILIIFVTKRICIETLPNSIRAVRFSDLKKNIFFLISENQI